MPWSIPDGMNHRWNDGRGPVTGADDVGFIQMLLDSLAARRFRWNSQRIYATGISNGAGMSFRLACDLPGTFAAIAPVAGALAGELEEPLRSRRTGLPCDVPGHRDPLMPYDGGVLTFGAGSVLPAPRTADALREGQRLHGSADGRGQPDTVTDGTRVRRSTYSGCRDGRDVVLFTIEGGGHTWPGGPPVGRSVGRVTRDLDATRVMLDFFDRHPQ